MPKFYICEMCGKDYRLKPGHRPGLRPLCYKCDPYNGPDPQFTDGLGGGYTACKTDDYFSPWTRQELREDEYNQDPPEGGQAV